MDWDEVGKGKRRERKKKSMSRLSLVKQSEMILPSVLSEASSLVAERGSERERVEERKGKKQRETKRIDTDDYLK